MPFTIAPTTMMLGLGAIALLLVTIARLGPPRRSSDACYHRKPVLSPWERKALGVIGIQLRPGLHLCPQVRLADMLDIEATDRSQHFRALNQVASKSVDFVIADVVTGNPVLVIELDDRSHRRKDRQTRDAFVNEVLREAGIPIVRFQPSQRLDIRPHLAAALNGVAAR